MFLEDWLMPLALCAVCAAMLRHSTSHALSTPDNFDRALQLARALDCSPDKWISQKLEASLAEFREVYRRSYSPSFSEADIEQLVVLRGSILDCMFKVRAYLPNDAQQEQDIWAVRVDLQNALLVYVKEAVQRQGFPSNAEPTFPLDDALTMPVKAQDHDAVWPNSFIS